MPKTYDLIVIGSGVAGGTAARACCKKGWSTAVIDKNPLGGTCSQRGCDPKKILAGAAEIIDRIRLMKGKGVNEGSSINWGELMRYKKSFTGPVHENTENSFKKLGIEVFKGIAKFYRQTNSRSKRGSNNREENFNCCGAKA
jgi:glutathione reductase (NADPH)